MYFNKTGLSLPTPFCCQQVAAKMPEEIYDIMLGKSPHSLLYIILLILGISFFIKFQFYLRLSKKHKVLKKIFRAA